MSSFVRLMYGSPIYSITPGDGWTQISSSPDGVIVFGYGTADTLTEIDMEGSASQLINTITLTDKLPNIEYKSMAETNDLDYKIRAWIVASEECGSSDPDVVYRMVKDLKNENWVSYSLWRPTVDGHR